ncbi:unnamed protein product [Allacma fusca]|uniref:Uncharacterized protein n=1 Tax=Allacma fusca TaxID=39272 RepID=A0A8J2IXL5_9HEXA|nr:unnamed protein product [Allacma fusca]
MSSCRFARRSQCQGQRFAHPFFAFVETGPTEESSNESDTESFWSQLIDMVDEGILEFTRQMSLKEEEPKKESPKEKCGLRRNSVDPVNTFVHKMGGKFTSITIYNLSFDERNKKKWPAALSQTEDNLSSLLLNPGPQTWIWDCCHSSSTWLIMGGRNCVPKLQGRDSNQ